DEVTGMTHVVVVGGGIAGVATALALRSTPGTAPRVTLLEAESRLGGKIAGGPFAGLDDVDEGADAFLARVPEAVDLATDVGLGESLVSPEPVGAAVWRDGLVDLPEGLVLGLPGRLRPLATTPLLSTRGKARAALEPLLPRTSVDGDSLGAFVRARFGDEVQDRLVDALVGSIYATDTDRFSLAEVPQLASLAREHRSILLGARSAATASPGTGSAEAAPVFAAPRAGMNDLVTATAEAFERADGTIRRSTPVESLDRTAGGGWHIAGEDADAVVLACPPVAAAGLLRAESPGAADLLERAETADVVMVTLHVAADEWPDRLRGRSGYLVPKPDQRWVTAASFGSQKWAHWRPPGGGEILRVSLGRDGMPVLHLTDDEVVEHVVADLARQLDIEIAPLDVRITRWPGAFAQYRPHHRDWVERVEGALPTGVYVTGAGYRGIGIPACIRAARATASRCAAGLGLVGDS
ncbi:MAG: protoporphyrinogen oxidase, partial [Ilumatobacteraceae bacterium]